MQELLMFMYHLTPDQAAARVPAAQFAITAVFAAAFVWLDSVGALDGLGCWLGKVLREVLDAVSED